MSEMNVSSEVRRGSLERLKGSVFDLRIWMGEQGLSSPDSDGHFAQVEALIERESRTLDEPRTAGDSPQRNAGPGAGDAATATLLPIIERRRQILKSRLERFRADVQLLESLREKNHDLLGRLMRRAESEHGRLDATRRRLTSLRRIMLRHSGTLLAHLDANALEVELQVLRDAILAGHTGEGAPDPMQKFFATLVARLSLSAQEGDEIHGMVVATHLRFSEDSRYGGSQPRPFEDSPYLREIAALERSFEDMPGEPAGFGLGKRTLRIASLDALANQSRSVFNAARQEAEAWLGSLLGPFEGLAPLQQRGLESRLAKIKRIHEAVNELETQIQRAREVHKRTQEMLNEIGYLETALRQSAHLD